MATQPRPASWFRQLADLLDGTQTTDLEGAPLGQDRAFLAALELILAVRAARSKVMVVGNGGSAAIASHLQTDLAHSLGIRALVFTEPSTLTAQANDHGYEHAYRNLTRLWAEPGDLLVAISSSGRSANISPFHVPSIASAALASAERATVRRSKGSKSWAASDSVSFCIAAKLSRLCLGRASSKSAMRLARYGSVHSLVRK